MTRRNRELQSEDHDFQDGARTPRGTAKVNKAADWVQDSGARLARYAHISPPSQDTSRRDSEHGRPLIQMGVSEEEEDSDMEVACSTNKQIPATRLKARRGMEVPNILQSEPTLRDVFRAVNSWNTALSSLTLQFDSLQEDITNIRHDIQKAAERATLMETRISELEDRFTHVQHDTRKK